MMDNISMIKSVVMVLINGIVVITIKVSSLLINDRV